MTSPLGKRTQEQEAAYPVNKTNTSPAFRRPAASTDEVSKMKEVFDSFDLDGSKSISVSELSKAVLKLGLVVKQEELQKMVMAVDDDKSGEVEFEEFKRIIGLASGGTASAESEGFKAFINKKKDSKPMVWQGEKKASQVVFEEPSDGGYLVCSREATNDGTYGVAVISDFLSGTSKGFDLGTIILKFEAVSDDTYVGYVGRNYMARDFTEDLSKNKMAAVVRCGDGDLSGTFCNKGAEPDKINRLGGRKAKIGKGARLHMSFEMQTRKCQMELLDDDDTSAEVLASMAHDVDIAEVAVAVCFGPGGGRVRIVGSSCDRSPNRVVRRSSLDLWDDDNVVKAATEFGAKPTVDDATMSTMY